MQGSGQGVSEAQYAELLNLIEMLKTRAGGAIVAPLKSSVLQVEGIAATPAANQPLPNFPAAFAGKISTFGIAIGQTAFAAGESVSITMQKNGVALLTAPIVLNAATGNKVFVSEIGDLASTAVAVGDEITATIAYTAGGGPAHPDFSIVLTWI